MRLLVDCRVFNLGWNHYVYLYSAFSNVNLVDWTDFSLSVVPWSRWITLVGIYIFILYNFKARCGLSLENHRWCSAPMFLLFWGAGWWGLQFSTIFQIRIGFPGSDGIETCELCFWCPASEVVGSAEISPFGETCGSEPPKKDREKSCIHDLIHFDTIYIVRGNKRNCRP